jgi:hypothetical protein
MDRSHSATISIHFLQLLHDENNTSDSRSFWWWKLASGKLTVCELEHGHIEIVDFPMKNGGSLHSLCKRFPEG